MKKALLKMCYCCTLLLRFSPCLYRSKAKRSWSEEHASEIVCTSRGRREEGREEREKTEMGKKENKIELGKNR